MASMELTPTDLEDEGDRLVDISIAFAALTTVIIGLRYYAKRFTSVSFGTDDVFLIAAYVLNLGMCALGIVMVKIAGVGRHVIFIEENNPALLTKWAQCILAFEILYFSSVAMPKLAILFLYLRVFNWKGPMRVVALGLIVVVAGTGLGLVLTACFQCRPINFWWDHTIVGGTCIDVQAFFHASSIPQFVLDFFIMGLPLKTIWDLKMPTYKRLALVLIFMVASFGVVASIIRAKTFFQTSAFSDRTFASVELVGWSIIETGTYIIATCLPHLRPLIVKYTPQWLKGLVHRTIAYTSSSFTTRKTTHRADDEIELTGKTLVKSSAGKSMLPGQDDGSTFQNRDKSTVSTKSNFDTRPSADIVDGRPWNDSGNNIRVTNEVTIESFRKSSQNKETYF
ncbi:uncharacterized protein BCR38DRAFT_456740 [Pseudomassariella vexata]|uniref:Rhodopsin domain-containing protein n=1 Tax=Pseudomassariella vexata TaxID=1141098 RepID=A0A1Y2E3L2_9PEZI|nr:uncharacterized protein BCR38DRAFT_456740 [Pseudomassariella vexata]ORY66099.1 hypothetical protein BCR38DRAFT_456740 [Pseudomassariella vexata]